MAVPPGWEDSQPEVPVVFFDGVEDIKFGNVVINVGLRYTQFVSNVCEKIGKSPSQISIFLVKNPYYPAPEGPLVVPAKEDINFDFLCLQNDIIFLVVLKRLELMSRNPLDMTKGNGVAFNELMAKNPRHDWPVNFVRTHRNEQAPVCRSFSEVLKAPLPKRVNRPRFTWGHGNNLDTVSNIKSSRMMAITKENKKGFCKDCKNAKQKGEMAGFDHPCVDNLEIVGFRTPVGPMALAMNDPEGRRDVPVVFFDGGKQKNFGNFTVSPDMEYMQFESNVSNKTGLPRNQIYIYLGGFRDYHSHLGEYQLIM